MHCLPGKEMAASSHALCEEYKMAEALRGNILPENFGPAQLDAIFV